VQGETEHSIEFWYQVRFSVSTISKIIVKKGKGALKPLSASTLWREGKISRYS